MLLNILQTHRTAPTTKNFLIQNVYSAEGENPALNLSDTGHQIMIKE